MRAAPTPPAPAPFDAVDREALLCALVLAPGTFPRNRFFGLFVHPDARRARARAAQLRAIVRQLAAKSGPPARIIEESERADGGAVLRYTVDELRLTRTAHLDPVELSALRFALHQATGGAWVLPARDKSRVEAALARLCPPAPLEF